MEEKYIYRIRPINSNTLDELKHSYLWFSRPCGFKGDVDDANIGAFVEDTETIKKGLLSLNPEFPFDDWYEEMSHIGICCFTTEIPSAAELFHFPKCAKGKGICIEYDKTKMKDFFTSQSKIPLPPIFHKIIYDDEPTKIESCDEWSILWEKYDGFKVYKTIENIFKYSHKREIDKFIFKLCTRLKSIYCDQKEERMILGGCLIPNHNPDVVGYQIPIPSDVVNRIMVYSKVSQTWVNKLKMIDDIREKIEYI